MTTAGLNSLAIGPQPWREGHAGPLAAKGRLRSQGEAGADPAALALTTGAAASGCAAAVNVTWAVRTYGTDGEDGAGEGATRDGSGEKAVRVTLALNMPVLGEVQVGLIARGDALQAEIVAPGPEEEAFLRSRLPELEGLLAETFKVESIRVRSKVDMQR